MAASGKFFPFNDRFRPKIARCGMPAACRHRFHPEASFVPTPTHMKNAILVPILIFPVKSSLAVCPASSLRI
jgi:hypothetical protein